MDCTLYIVQCRLQSALLRIQSGQSGRQSMGVFCCTEHTWRPQEEAQSNSVQCNPMQFNAVQCSPMQFNAVQCAMAKDKLFRPCNNTISQLTWKLAV